MSMETLLSTVNTSILGENIADNGGMKAAFRAFTSLSEDRYWPYGDLPGLNMTNNQLFFMSFAQVNNIGRFCPVLFRVLLSGLV